MLRSAAIKRVLPAIAVAAVLGASLLASPLGGIIASVGCSYGYLGAPTVTGVSPASGSGASNNFVTITGCGFTGATSVHFGATAAADFDVVSDSQVDAASPIHAAGTVDVTVTTPAGTSATSASDQYTFVTFAAGHECTSATISPGSVNKPAGSTINFTASSLGCPNPQYAFWLKYPNGTWSLRQSFSTNPTFSFNTNFFPPSLLAIRVWANEAPSATRYDTFAQSSVTLTGCTSATLSPPTGSSAVGVTVVFTATGSGCPNPIFAFFVKDTAGKWHLMQPFSVGTNTWAWHPVGWAKGTYTIEVWANQQGSYVRVHQGAAVATHTLT